MKFSLVSVNFNNTDATINMLNSLIDGWSYVSKIVIVDNDSEVEEFSKLKKYEKKICSEKLSIVKAGSNLGYFGGLNYGLSQLNEKKSTYTIICNNDVVFNKVFFRVLEKLSVADEVYAVCPSVRTIDGVYQNPSMVTKPSKLRTRFYRLYYSNYFLGLMLLKMWRCFGLGADSRKIKDIKQKEIFIGIGAIYILMPPFFHHNKALNYPAFLYGEEAFLSMQIAKTGGKQLYYPELEVIHEESVATSKLPKKDKYKMTKASYRLYRGYYEG